MSPSYTAGELVVSPTGPSCYLQECITSLRVFVVRVFTSRQISVRGCLHLSASRRYYHVYTRVLVRTWAIPRTGLFSFFLFLFPSLSSTARLPLLGRGRRSHSASLRLSLDNTLSSVGNPYASTHTVLFLGLAGSSPCSGSLLFVSRQLAPHVQLVVQRRGRSRTEGTEKKAQIPGLDGQTSDYLTSARARHRTSCLLVPDVGMLTYTRCLSRKDCVQALPSPKPNLLYPSSRYRHASVCLQ